MALALAQEKAAAAAALIASNPKAKAKKARRLAKAAAAAAAAAATEEECDTEMRSAEETSQDSMNMIEDGHPSSPAVGSLSTVCCSARLPRSLQFVD